MSTVNFRRTFYTPDNLINEQSVKAALTYSCNGIQGIEYIYCENLDMFSVEIDETLDINTIVVNKDSISISPATKFTYFLDKNKILSVSGSFAGDAFHAFLDRDLKIMKVYNMPKVVKYYKTDSDVFSYKSSNGIMNVFIPEIVGDFIIKSQNGPDILTCSAYFNEFITEAVKDSAKKVLCFMRPTETKLDAYEINPSVSNIEYETFETAAFRAKPDDDDEAAANDIFRKYVVSDLMTL